MPPFINHVDQVTQRLQHAHGDVDRQQLVEDEPHGQRHEHGDEQDLTDVALADEPHDSAGHEGGGEHIAQHLKERDIGNAQRDDEHTGQDALVLHKIDAGGRLGEGIVLLHANQLEDGLNQQDDGERHHAKAHHLREGGRLHGGLFDVLEAQGLHVGPDFKGQQDERSDEIGKRLGLRLLQLKSLPCIESLVITRTLTKEGQAMACPSWVLMY